MHFSTNNSTSDSTEAKMDIKIKKKKSKSGISAQVSVEGPLSSLEKERKIGKKQIEKHGSYPNLNKRQKVL